MTRTVQLTVPAGFINDRALLRPGELAVGYRRGWLRDDDVVALALAAYTAFPAVPSAMEELALLLTAELDRVGGLVGRLDDEPESDAVWTFLALAWLYENRAAYTEPLAMLELLYADLDHPAQIEPFIRYMPGPPIGEAGLIHNWGEYCAAEADRYRHRAAT